MPQGSSGFLCPTIGRLFRPSVVPPVDPSIGEVALAIYHGGKIDGLRGMEAVAHVIQNRIYDPAFNSSPQSIVAAGTEQFVDIKKALPTPHSATEKRLFDLAKGMATQLVAAPQQLSFPDPTRGALYYDQRKPATKHSIRCPLGMTPPAGTSSSSTQAPPAAAAATTPAPAAATGVAASTVTDGPGTESTGSLTAQEVAEGDTSSPRVTSFSPPLGFQDPVQPQRGRQPLGLFRDRRSAAQGSALSASFGPATSAPQAAVASVARESGQGLRQVPSSALSSSHRSPPVSDPIAIRPPVAGNSTPGMSSGSTRPPTPPLSSPTPQFGLPPSLALGNSVSSSASAARLPPMRPMLPRAGVTAAPTPPNRRVDGDTYHDMVLPCGLFQEEVIELMYRDLSPEDFDMLNKLDERLPKRNTASRNIVDRLPFSLAKDCGSTECRVCLAEFEPNALVVKLPCGHAFHRACISKWLTQFKNQCPLCFAPINLQTPAPMAAAGGNTGAAASSILRAV